MWYNPKYERPDHPAPPVEHGHRLGTWDRGQGEELRLSLEQYNGHPYLSLRVWRVDRDGHWWPIRGKGVSIRLREVPGLAEILATVAERLDRRAPARLPQPEQRGQGAAGQQRRPVDFDEGGPDG